MRAVILACVIPSLEALDWHKFLARPPLPLPSQETVNAISHCPILITGAGGSIGSALAMRLAEFASRLISLETSESHLFALQTQFAESAPAEAPVFVLGSIDDCALLDEIFFVHAPRLVFHAAAFKHVPLMEEQPLAAVANNVFGTATLCAAASRHNARVVLLSTDKAVEPASVMGATKRVAERIVLAAGGTVLRLGNVLASRDSVAESFARQIAAGEPLTVTDPAARRYFLTLEEAVNLLTFVAAESDALGLFAPDLPASQFITDLAQFMARRLAPGRAIPIRFTQTRAGDKETERLWSVNETASPAKTPGLLSIHSPTMPPEGLQKLLEVLRASLESRDLAVALDCLCALVPDYTPSPTLLALHAAITSQVADE